MADGEQDEEITLGDLHAGHIGRTIVLGYDDLPLGGSLAAVSHRAEPGYQPATEVTVLWHQQRITISEPSSMRAVLRAVGRPERFVPPPPLDERRYA